jgi:phosphoglycerol transferase MdoB-like AlkP superfamily enzyme
MRAITNYLENKKIDGIIPLYNSTENEYTVTLRLTGENNIFAKIAKWVNNIFINFSYLIIAIIHIFLLFLFFILSFLFLFSRLKNNIVYFLLEFIISIALISITIFQYYFYNSVLYKLLEYLAIMIGLELFL